MLTRGEEAALRFFVVAFFYLRTVRKWVIRYIIQEIDNVALPNRTEGSALASIGRRLEYSSLFS